MRPSYEVLLINMFKYHPHIYKISTLSWNINNFYSTLYVSWCNEGGSRGLFQRVGTEMAEDGCPDAQFKLAKDLIQKPCGELSGYLIFCSDK